MPQLHAPAAAAAALCGLPDNHLASVCTMPLRALGCPALTCRTCPLSHRADQMQRLQRILSLADVEDARLRLAALELRNPLMGAPALAQALQVRPAALSAPPCRVCHTGWDADSDDA